MPLVHNLQHLIPSLKGEDPKAPREILALLVFLGEMVTLVSQDNQVPLVLLVPPESVSHVLLVVRTILRSMTPTMSSPE